jgi:PIN domain
MNHVFVDFENVHEVDPSVIGAKSVSLTLLLGARQTRLDAALVEKLMEHAASVQLVRLTFSGKNALDFTLAYYVGRAVMTDPNGCFHIVSKDTGFEPLIEHLRSRHIHAQRHDDFTTLTFSGPAKPPSAPPEDLWTRVLERLGKNVTNRPKRKKALVSHLLAFLGKAVTEADVVNLIEKLRKAGRLSIGDKDAVTYHD